MLSSNLRFSVTAWQCCMMSSITPFGISGLQYELLWTFSSPLWKWEIYNSNSGGEGGGGLTFQICFACSSNDDLSKYDQNLNLSSFFDSETQKVHITNIQYSQNPLIKPVNQTFFKNHSLQF